MELTALIEEQLNDIPPDARALLVQDVVERRFRAGNHVALTGGADGARLVSTGAFAAGATCFLVDHALEFPAEMLADLPRMSAWLALAFCLVNYCRFPNSWPRSR